MDKIKAFIEKWNHRLQGHLLVTYKNNDGEYVTAWAIDIFTSSEYFPWLCVDMCDGGMALLISRDEFTITGA